MQCNAIIDYQPDTHGFIPVRCGQVVAIRTYTTTAGFTVGYCPRKGHQAQVRRNHQEVEHPEDFAFSIDDLMALGERFR